VKFEVCRSDGQLLTVMLNGVRRSGDPVYDMVSVVLAEERNTYERQLLFERRRSEELAAQQLHAQRVLQAAESQLRQAVRVGGLHLWSADESGARHYELSVTALLGLDGEADMHASRFLEAIVEADREGEEAAFQAALTGASSVHKWTFRIRDRNGNEKILVSSGQAFGEGGSNRRRFVGVLRDVTEEARKSAEAEDRALFAEQMVGIVSHDLRNPLSAITVGAAVLARGSLTERQQRVLQSIDRSTHRAKRLIDELLDFTLVRVGHGLTVALKPVKLHELCSQMVDELKLAFPANDIQHVALGPDACEVDPDRIAQLVGNLVANAVSYGATGSLITVGSIGDQSGCRLQVHNLGEPIPPHMLGRIFEPLVRGGAAGGAVRSVGLGLFIVKAIADAHGATMTVTSNRSDGTTFACAFERAQHQTPSGTD
jgi:sigma-B regulation protein RsbU (phosphoserine phosphatase)